MSLKTAILKKRLQKNSVSLDSFLIEQFKNIPSQLVEQIMELLKEESSEILAKKEAEFAVSVEHSLKKVRDITSALETQLTDIADSDKKDAKEVLRAIKEKIAIHKEVLLQDFKTDIEKAMAHFEMLLKDSTRFKGAKGATGAKGEGGTPGPKGLDGSPDTADQVVDKVNDAKKKVKMSSIFGLEERLNDFKKLMRGSGGKSSGGMGNVYHETKNVNANTTSVSLTYGVAANGRAIWAYYEGQFLVYGTHYTVNNNVLTLTISNLVDSTYLDITYIRG